ncbi:12432_t:CDS:2 [Funneliformis geosporum]|uniref:Peroxisomal membrane protein PEX14 n=1 Tax=Funneliformis geosporum TaxID=1117311 RepID=A0A9W4SCS8_9GLOM|nr:9480_t:CDS:2 [Funneliformis geosporum]CAI2164369.1 12432_t:CDS:2 [Funneliformis geosporum]
MSIIRQELVQSAVNFLKDPQVKNSPLQKRVAFLESKGLSSEEIEEALKKVKDVSPSVVPPLPPPPSSQGSGQVMITQPPPVPRMDWRDFFIAAVFVGGIGYAIVAVTKKYILPLLKTPTAKELEMDKQALNDQFNAASETLNDVKSDTQIVKKTIEEQVYKVKESLETLDKMMSDIKQQEVKRDADLKILKEDMDAIRELITKLLEKTKDTQNQSLSEVQQELKSLKSLLLNRRSNSTGSPIADALSSSSSTTTPFINTTTTSPTIPSVSSPFPGVAIGRPSIPSWQMGMNNTSTAIKVPVEQNNSTSSDQNGTSAVTSNGAENNNLT